VKTSRAGKLALLVEEGIAIKAHLDSARVWTVGVGHTAAAGGLKPAPGMAISIAQALALFEADLVTYERAVAAAVTAPLSQQQFDALVSFHYNSGAIRSGSVDDKLNANQVAQAIATLKMYNKVRGPDGVLHISQGLADRRAREAAIFTAGTYRRDDIPLWTADDNGLHMRVIDRIKQADIRFAADPSPPPPQQVSAGKSDLPADVTAKPRSSLWSILTGLFRR